ncbi:hypothetical protein BpHYR1_025206, partial [Brachionus plicatilis]
KLSAKKRCFQLSEKKITSVTTSIDNLDILFICIVFPNKIKLKLKKNKIKLKKTIRIDKYKKKEKERVRFSKSIFLCLNRNEFKSRSFSKENVNSPKELNPRLPRRLNCWFGEIDGKSQAIIKVGQDELFKNCFLTDIKERTIAFFESFKIADVTNKIELQPQFRLIKKKNDAVDIETIKRAPFAY